MYKIDLWGFIMTTELEMLTWILVLTLLMWIPYTISHIFNVGIIRALTYKADTSSLPDWAQRAKKAHYNSIENLVPFASLVIVANIINISNSATISAAIAYFWFRLAYYGLYVTNIPFGRTLAFAGGWLAQICILTQICP
jgi:uncharacterized MAPEG superfamily protein